MTPQTLLNQITKLGLMLMMGVSMSACSKSWKEEVQLHDGSKIIVERTVDRGGRHEIGQQSPIKAQSLTFTLPATHESIAWKSEFSKDVGLADFQPLLLDIFQGAVYVVTNPVGCLAYNKWGRPNPPYVVFRYQNKEWKRISLQELPAEIKTPNLIFSSPDEKAEQIGKNPVPAETIQKIVSDTFQPEYKSILREPLKSGGDISCGEMYPDGKGGWLGVGWFRHSTQKECTQFCAQRELSAEFCKCFITK